MADGGGDTRNEREEIEVDVENFSGVGLETELQMESNISDKTKEMTGEGKSLLSHSTEVTESGSISDMPDGVPCEQSEFGETILNECGQTALLSEEPLLQDLADNVSTSVLEILPEDPSSPINEPSNILPEEEMADYEKEVNEPSSDSAKPRELNNLIQDESDVPMASLSDDKENACISDGNDDTETAISEMDDVEAQTESAMVVDDEDQIQVEPVFPRSNSREVDGNDDIEADHDSAYVKEHSANKGFVAGDELDSEGQSLSENAPSDLEPSQKTSSLVLPEHSQENLNTLDASLTSSQTEDLDTCTVHEKSLSLSEIENTVNVSQHNGFSQVIDSCKMDVVNVVSDAAADDCSCESTTKDTELTDDLDANMDACENTLKESNIEYSEGGKEQATVNLENSQDMSDFTDSVDHVEPDAESSDTGCDDKFADDGGRRTENELFSKLDAEIIKASDASSDTIAMNDDALDTNLRSNNSQDVEISQNCDEMSRIDDHSDENLNQAELGLEDTTDGDGIQISKVKAGPTEKLLSISPTNEIEEEPMAKEELDENSTANDNMKTAAGTLQTSDADNQGSKSDAASSSDNQTQQKTGKNAQLSKGKKLQECVVCRNMAKCKYNIVRNDDTKHLCDDKCFQLFRSQPTTYLQADSSSPGAQDTCLCAECQKPVPANTKGKNLFKTDKEIKKFCSSACLNVFKKSMKLCASCEKDLQDDANAIAVPIEGEGSKDFCCHACLVKYEHSKKHTTKIEEDDDDVRIVESTLAPKAKTTSARQPTSGKAKCSVCSRLAIVRQEVNFKGVVYKLCGDACISTFRIMHHLSVSPCDDCSGMYSLDDAQIQSIQFEGLSKTFCSAQCLSNFKTKKQCVVQCTWCSTRKSNFDMVERLDANNKFQLFCSLNCLSMYRVNLQANSNQSVACDQCRKCAPALYHLTMSDASVRNFCGYNCVMAFQAQFSQPSTTSGGELPTPSDRVTANAANSQPTVSAVASSQPTRNSPYGTRNSSRAAKSAISPTPVAQMQSSTMPVISNIVSLAAGSSGSPSSESADNKNASGKLVAHIGVQSMASQEVIVQPSPPKQVKNKALLCKPFMQTKATSCRPHTVMKGSQTEENIELRRMILPCPVPAVTPAPMMMYSKPVPFPVIIPVPIPIPVFIPTTKKSSAGIMRKIKELQERVPSDPFEAELLMMAEAVANANKADDSDSETEDEDADSAIARIEKASIPVEARRSNGELAEDMLQMALRMAEMQSEQTLDLEDAVDPTPIRAREPVTPVSMPVFDTIAADPDILHASHAMTSPRGGRGRGKRRGASRGSRGSSSSAKKPRVDEEPIELTPAPVIAPPVIAETPADANCVLKFTYGVNAYKHWAIQKNAHLEQVSPPKPGMRQRLFKLDLLQCCTDELNYALCLFVKEVRKPNGEEYAPDSIYYLCLGIQEYLYENGRIDNLFTDFFYEKFTECLNEVLGRYEVRLNAQGMLVCRIEEEHLWEAKQLGAHSPHVLLNTLVYFNAKHFMLRSPEDHLGLSFSHIMKHWKKTSTSSGKPGRSVYLRYYAPSQLGADAAQKRKKEELPVFEQSENVDNPLRCPVKLYEFYISKCPESIKNRSDVFYLVPERSCVPDSPVWYSAMSLSLEAMTRMLNRLRVVREIQESQLTSLAVPYYN